MSTGIEASQAAFDEFTKVKGPNATSAFAVFGVEKRKSIECSFVSEITPLSTPDGYEENIWAKVVEYVSENLKKKAAYIAVDFHYLAGDRPASKILLINWNPENEIKAMEKMTHAGSLEGLKSYFAGTKSVQATEIAELDYAGVVEQM